MTPLIDQINEAINQAKLEHENHCFRMSSWKDITDADSFEAGSNLLMPIVKKLIEDRNNLASAYATAKSNYDIDTDEKEIIYKLDTELIKLLKEQAK